MNRTLTIIISAVIISLAIVAGCFLLSQDTNKPADVDDIEGYWYQIDYEGYENGNYIQATTENGLDLDYKYNLNIKEHRDGVFYGVFEGYAVSGTFDNGVVSIYRTLDGVRTWFYGTVSEGIMYAVVTEKTDAGQSAYLRAYSKDYSALASMEGAPVISGDWIAHSAINLSGNVWNDLGGKNLKIVEQHGYVFMGTMEQLVDGETKTLDVAGALSKQKNGGYNIGYAVCNKENWTVTANEDAVILLTTMKDDTGITENLTHAVFREYTRDGGPSDVGTVDLSGSTWIIDSANGAFIGSGDYSNNRIYDMDETIAMSFENQHGNLFSGTIYFWGTTYDIVGYTYGSDLIAINSTIDKSNIYGIGKISDGIMNYNHWPYISTMGYSAQSIQLSNIDMNDFM
jgi:hypothetical protein